jgi:MYXO-CTERM domain-containing protein
MKWVRASLIFSALCFPLPSLATPFVPRDKLLETQHPPAVLPGGVRRIESLQSDAMMRLALIASFEKSMQYTMPCAGDAGADCNFGGIIEVASGPGNAIVESDNSQEAVWDWSYTKENGDATDYSTQVAGVFEFLSVDDHAGYNRWKETGDPGPDYYSIYNCGWGVRAVVEYEKATGDMSHHAYGAMCAQHLADNAMNVAMNSTKLIDVGTASWGASGLYLWGEANSDANAKSIAAAVGGVAKAWLDTLPSRASLAQWAMTGGVVFYAVVNTYMKEHPAELDAWVTTIAPHLGGWIDESMPANPNDWTDWRNAWNAWNMLGQFTASRVTTGSLAQGHQTIALDIYSKLVAQDTDGNGGIPASQQRPDTEDESWITSYLAYFGVREILTLPPPAMPDMSMAGTADMAMTPINMNMNGPGGGCSCAVGGSPSLPTGTAGLFLALVALYAIRSRRSSRAPGRGRSRSR